MTTTVLAYIPSPSQGVWHLGPFPVRAYALFIIAGIIAALVIGDRRWVARGGQPGVIYDVALWAVPFGLIGGRLYHVLTDWRTYFGEGGVGAAGALRIWDGGLGIWGAVALGGVGAWIACRRYGIPLPAFGDAVAPGIVLAQAIGRLGNYFNQELYGRETTVPWGLEIYERVNTSGVPDALNGVSTGQLVQVVHPTFLYELLWNLLVFVVLIVVDRRFNIGHGRLFALYVAGYCAGRFWIELLRSDAATELAGIRVNSFTSTFVFIGAVVYIMAAPKGREDPATLRGKVDVEAGAEDLAKVAAVASGGGIVAAAKAAEEDAARESKGDEAEVEALISELESGESSPSAGGLGSVDGDEAAAAVADAGVAHEVAVEGEAEAEELVADVESEPEQEVVDAESVIAVDESGEAEVVEAEAGGLGSVDGDEVAASVADAGVAHEVAVEGEADAEELVADVESESEQEVVDAESVIAVDESGEAEVVEGDAEELVADVESEPEQEVVDAESVIAVDESGEAEVVEAEAGGLGSVDGDEVAASVADAGVAHEVAVEGEGDAEELVADVESESEQEVVDAESVIAVDESGEAEVVEAEELVADVESESEQEVVDAESVIAVDESGEAEVVEAEELVADVESEPEADVAAEVAEVDAESVIAVDEVVEADAGGLGSVDGDEVAASVADAGVAHEVAVEGEAEAEELVADVESEPETDVAAEVAEVDVESVIAVDESGEAEVVEAEAEELVADVESEPETDVAAEVAEVDVESVIAVDEAGAADAGGLGSVDGDEAAAAVADAGAAHEVAVEGEADAEELVADVESEPDAELEVADAEPPRTGTDEPVQPTAPAAPQTPFNQVRSEVTQRVRQWVRRRRNR